MKSHYLLNLRFPFRMDPVPGPMAGWSTEAEKERLKMQNFACPPNRCMHIRAHAHAWTWMDMFILRFFRTNLISLRLRTMSSETKSRAPGWNFLRAVRGRLSSPIVMFSHMGWMTTYAYFDLSTDDICPRIMNKILVDYGKACGESYILHIYIIYTSLYWGVPLQ